MFESNTPSYFKKPFHAAIEFFSWKREKIISGCQITRFCMFKRSVFETSRYQAERGNLQNISVLNHPQISQPYTYPYATVTRKAKKRKLNHKNNTNTNNQNIKGAQ